MWVALKESVRNGWLHPRYIAQREIRNFISSEAGQMTGRLLDVGCGKKPYAHLFANITEYVGCDVETTMHGIQHADVIGSVMDLPFPGESFDSLLCTEVLEHTPDPARGLREMARVARPGARLLLTVPFSEQLHEEPYDFCRFTPHWLRFLLDENGWGVEKLSRRGGPWLELGYRVSSLLYSELGSTKEADGNLKPRPLLGPPIVLLCGAVQVAGAGLNRISTSQLSTIGFGVVATRKSGQ